MIGTESFLSSGRFFDAIRISGVIDPLTNEDFLLEVKISNFKSLRIGLWDDLDNRPDRDPRFKQFSDRKSSLLSTNILNLVNLLEEIIQGEGNGRVRIFLLYDTGRENLGYQYFKNKGSIRKIRWLFKDPTYIDLDLSSGNTIEQRYKLIHLAHIMLATGTAIVIKQESATYNDKSMICALNFNGFLNKDEIYSGPSTQQMLVESYSTNFYDNIRYWNKRWEKTLDILIGFTSRGSSSDFVRYINEIYSGTSRYSEILKPLLTFDSSS